MKKMIRLLNVFLLTGILILSSCTKKDKEIFNIVPETTLAVLTFNPGTLIEKGKMREMESIRHSMDDEEFISEIFMNPEESGIETNAYSAFFIFNFDDVNYGSLLMPVADESTFESFLEDLKAEYDMELVPEEQEGYTLLSHNNLMVAYNDERVMVLSGMLSWSDRELSTIAMELINTEKDMSLLADKDFNKFLSNQKDINLWVSSTNMDDLPGMQQMEGFMGIFQGFKNNYGHVHLEFAEGALVLSSNVALNPDMKETIREFNFLDKNASKENLRFLPSDNLILAGNASLNPEKLLGLIKMTGTDISRELEEIEDKLEMENGDLEDMFKGNFALSVNGIREVERTNHFDEDFSYMKKAPVITMVAELKNKALLTDIMSYVEKEIPVEQKGDYWIFREGGHEAFMLIHEGFLIISNIEKNIDEIASRGELKENLSKSEVSGTLVKDPLCLFVNLDQDSYSEDIKDYIENDLDDDMAVGIKSFGSNLKSLTISGGMERSELKIEFKNENQNSLYTILAQIDSM